MTEKITYLGNTKEIRTYLGNTKEIRARQIANHKATQIVADGKNWFKVIPRINKKELRDDIQHTRN